jgi:hypothetical protein
MTIVSCADIVWMTLVSCVESGFFVALIVMGMSLAGILTAVRTGLLFADEGSFGGSF